MLQLVTAELLERMNEVYSQLDQKRVELLQTLRGQSAECVSGFYNGHYRRTESGDYQMDSFPIPVISVKGCCDIEINFDTLTVSAKLSRSDALACSFEKFADIPFEVYGVENYLLDFYLAGMTVAQMHAKISGSTEKEIGVSFVFPFDVKAERICKFVEQLHHERFYY